MGDGPVCFRCHLPIDEISGMCDCEQDFGEWAEEQIKWRDAEIERLRGLLKEARSFIEWGAPPDSMLQKIDDALRGEGE